MKRFKIYIILLSVIVCGIGCKKFLNVNPLDSLSGNNYWKSKDDVEKFAKSIYNQFRTITAMNTGYSLMADLRCGIFVESSGNIADRSYIGLLAANNIRGIVSSTLWWNTPDEDYGIGFYRIPNWNDWYKMIQLSNLLYQNVANVPDGALSDADIKNYKAEAVFLRCIAYFYLVRLFGDVPYYTNADQTEALPRTAMVTVLQNCATEMTAHLNDLPWTFSDPSFIGVRAMRGAAIDLVMHMEMWSAGFDEGRKNQYYQTVDSIGNILLTQNNGAYGLVPLDQFKAIFKGNTKENLFEVPQSLNYGEQFPLGGEISDLVLHYPHKQPQYGHETSYMYVQRSFLDQVYPTGQADLRKDQWFDPLTMYSTNGDFEFLKFTNIFAEEGENVNPDDDYLVFRLPDAILLRAEACAELNKNQEAVDLLNRVRNRAQAMPYDIADVNSNDNNIKDAIFWERCKELMGEGYYYYDLIRTRKILSTKYTSHPMSYSAFINGAWTWPIDNAALVNNPYMRLNSYWN